MSTPSLLRVSLLPWLTEAPADADFRANLECKNRCGDVAILFPFGFGPNCSTIENFEVDCNDTFRLPKPFLTSIGMELLGVSIRGLVRVNNQFISQNCNDNKSYAGTIDLSGSPFVYLNVHNRFAATGCNNYAMLLKDDNPVCGCFSVCNRIQKIHSCHGLNYCQLAVPPNIKSFIASMTSYLYLISGSCSYNMTAFMVDQDWLHSEQRLDLLPPREYAAAVLEWGAFQGYRRQVEKFHLSLPVEMAIVGHSYHKDIYLFAPMVPLIISIPSPISA